MKHNFFFKLLIATAFCGLSLLGYGATPIYLSSGGDDSNNGLTADAPVATLAQAMSLVDAGGVINVSGMIDATSETILDKNVIIQGTSNTNDGFTGGNSARFISNGAFNLTLSNLKLTSFNASTGNNGGVLLLSGGTVNISNVNFDNNKALLGGALYVEGGNITIEGCVLQNSTNATVGSTGGGIYIKPTTALILTAKNTVIKNNTTESEGSAILYTNVASTVFTSSIKFTNCAVVSNSVSNSTTGGVMSINHNPTVGAILEFSMINSTIANNVTYSAAGCALFVRNLKTADSFIDFRNCTITANECKLSGTGGFGIRVVNTVTTIGSKVKFYNCILEGNFNSAQAVTSTNYSLDFGWQGEAFTPGTNLIIEKTMIGRTGTSGNANWAQDKFL
jgi:hypothetical protein